MYYLEGEKIMQIFLLFIILILIGILVYQWREIRDLERKTLEAFKIVCKKIRPREDDKKWN